MNAPAMPEAEALYTELLAGVKQLLRADTRLDGITSGGDWLVQRLQKRVREGIQAVEPERQTAKGLSAARSAVARFSSRLARLHFGKTDQPRRDGNLPGAETAASIHLSP